MAIDSSSDRLNVHLIGSMPPPYGGVSVHVSRLRHRLLAEGHSCTVWCDRDDPSLGLRHFKGTIPALRDLSALDSSPILHFHYAYLAAGLLAARGRRVVATFHDARLSDLTRGGHNPHEYIGRRLTGRMLREIPQLIGVSDEVKQALENERVPPRAISVINAYMPALGAEEAHAKNLALFSEFRKRIGLIATANAWAPRFFDGMDLYGLDLCIEMLDGLRDRWPELGLVLVVPEGRGNAYVQQLQTRVSELGLSERVLWLLESGAYHPILRECDIFLRPTNTDGFAVSIAEAFGFGLPVVASDAVLRPEGCLQFRSRDLSDFQERVNEVLGDRPTWIERSKMSVEPDHAAEVLGIYRRFDQRAGP